jgi:hypothetical protein
MMEDYEELPQPLPNLMDRFRVVWNNPNQTRFPVVTFWIVVFCALTGALQAFYNVTDPAGAVAFYGLGDVFPESLMFQYGVGGVICSSLILLAAVISVFYHKLGFRVFVFYLWIGLFGSFILLIVSYLLLIPVGLVGSILYFDPESSRVVSWILGK